MVFCIRKLNWMKAAPETKIFRNYAKYDPAKFCEDLRACLHGLGDPGLVGLVSFVFTLWRTQNKRNLPH